MKKLVHPNVVRLLEVIDDPQNDLLFMVRRTHVLYHRQKKIQNNEMKLSIRLFFMEARNSFFFATRPEKGPQKTFIAFYGSPHFFFAGKNVFL